MRDFSRHAKGAGRQYRDRRFRPFGFLDVFHAERVVSGLSSARWRRVRAAPTARRCSASAEFLPTITSATRWTRPTPRFCGPVSNGWRRCWPSPPMRQAFGRLGGRTLIAWDGTEYFCSQKLGCPNCLTRERSNGKAESYHSLLSATVVAPGHSKVVPLTPEFIATQDGADKQDCERNAVKRWFATHGERLAPLRPVFLGDDLFACHPVAKMVTDAGDDFIFTCKPKPRTRRSTTSSTEPSFRVTRRRSAAAPRKRPSVTAGSRPSRSATARTRSLVNWIGFEILDAKGKRQIFHGLGDQPSRHQGQCRRNRRLRPGADGKSRTRASTS